MHMSSRSILFLLLPLALTLLLAPLGCGPGGTIAGYSAGGTFPEDVRTVAVPIFENRSFYRGLEFRLTEALTKEIEHRTPYKVTEESGADTILTGTILAVDERLLSRDFDTGVAQEVQLVVTVGLEWKDLRSGEIIRKRSRLRASGEFIPRRGLTEPQEVARHEVVGDLSRRIVSVMRGDW